MAGGLEFFIDGEGLDDQPHISSVMFEPTQTDPNLFAGPPLNSKYTGFARLPNSASALLVASGIV